MSPLQVDATLDKQILLRD